ncbi:unnamed protein product, partial [Pylaiella littoralis]
LFSVFGRNEVAPSQNEGDVDLVEEEVSSKIMRYKGVFMKSTDLPPTEVLNYWSKVEKQMFPSLKYVAQQTFGVQASAAQVERLQPLRSFQCREPQSCRRVLAGNGDVSQGKFPVYSRLQGHPQH